MINTRTQHVLLCALCALLLFVVEVAAADGSGVDEVISNRRRRLKHLRSRRNLKGAPLNLFQQSQSTAEEVVATSQQLRGHNDDDQPPPSPTPPLNLFKQTRIINGDVVEGKNGAYPFQVQLGWGYCGGELIAPDIVLTAAHCIDGGSPSTVDIWDGSEMTRRPVERGAVHPNYSNKQLHDDIALMKLTEPALAVKEVNDGSKTYWELVDDYDWVEIPPLIRLQRYQTPSQCTSLFAQGLAEDITTMTVIGHGTTEGGNLSEELREADVHYVTNSVCQQQYVNVPITDDMLCASDTVDEQDACQGDSGGPLFTRLPAGDYQLLTLVGVVSWGEGCALKEFPGVYSRVTANADWVDEVVCGANGYSPKSCTADGKIRDFALDALVANNTRRRTQDVSTNISRTLADELVKGVDYAGPATLKEEVCELLGGNADETLSPSSSSPSTSDSPSHAPIIPPSMKPSVSPSSRPSHAPIISPSMKPSVSPSLKPSTTPSGSPSKPRGKSDKKKFITKDKNANQKAKGIMYQLQAETGDVIIESISFQKRDDKDTNVEVYFRLGSYEDFPGKGMNAYDWGPPVFDGIPAKTPSGLREAVLDDVLTILEGEMASIYLSGKKDFMFQKGGQEFTVSDDAGDFKVFTGSAMKKPFEQRLASADFVGEFTYYTYTRPTKVTSTPSFSPSSSPSLSPSSSPSSSKHPTLSPTSTPSLSPSSSNLPSLPPDEDTSSPSMLPSNLPSLTPSEGPSSSPSEDGRGGGPKEYKTPNVNKAGAGSKGVMFSITAKSKEVSITSLGMMGTETKESNLWIYYQNGSYDFDAMDEDEWIEAFKGKVVLDRNELVDVELAEEIVIPAGGTVSLYVLSKKGFVYTKSSADEFDIYAASEDFSMRVGVTTKKEFEKPEKLAEFAGRIMYQTKA